LWDKQLVIAARRISSTFFAGMSQRVAATLWLAAARHTLPVWQEREGEGMNRSDDVRIADAGPADVPGLAAIHVAALPGDLLPRLGRRYLERGFFPAVLSSPDAFVLKAELDGRLQGFVVFAWRSGRLTTAIGQRRRALLRAVAGRALKDPKLVLDLVRVLGRPRLTLVEPLPEPVAEMPELYLIATAPPERGRGLGARLLEVGVERILSARPRCLVRTSSPDAKRFYLRHGFRLIGREERGSRGLDLLLREAAAQP
jgi:ribosomal protein S18 acetylase RimI-like enzyme